MTFFESGFDFYRIFYSCQEVGIYILNLYIPAKVGDIGSQLRRTRPISDIIRNRLAKKSIMTTNNLRVLLLTPVKGIENPQNCTIICYLLSSSVFCTNWTLVFKTTELEVHVRY